MSEMPDLCPRCRQPSRVWFWRESEWVCAPCTVGPEEEEKNDGS